MAAHASGDKNSAVGKAVHSAAVLGEKPGVSVVQAANDWKPDLPAVVMAADTQIDSPVSQKLRSCTNR